MFGRNMDIHYSFNEKILYMQKGSKIALKQEKELILKYSILGVGTTINDYPFFADAMNEKGLAIAGLNFIGNAVYYPFKEGRVNITPYELPLYILGLCKTVSEVIYKLINLNILDELFSKDVPLAYLHFMVSDKKQSIVIEQTKEGLKVYDNDLNVLTNNPPFVYHRYNLSNYLNLSVEDPHNSKFDLISFNQGLIGLPGDYSSMSRFIKAYFVSDNILIKKEDEISQFFYVLDSVFMPKGLVKVGKDYEYTRYQTCYDLENCVLYYKTYDNRVIRQVGIELFNNGMYKTLNMF